MKTAEVLHGALVIDKPQGPTSFKALRTAQRALGQKTAGHAGTLDPMATGVLVGLFGDARKLSDYLMAADKSYDALVVFGAETDTLDAEGEVVVRSEPPANLASALEEILPEFIGEVSQVPPRYSALKRDGESYMSRARRGEVFEIPARTVECHAIEILELGPDRARLRVDCGKGYYIRALARDLGHRLGGHAHLGALRRLRVGRFSVEQGVAPELARPENLIPIRQLTDLPEIKLSWSEARALGYGQTLAPPKETFDKVALAIAPTGVPVALVELAKGRLRVRRGFNVDISGESD